MTGGTRLHMPQLSQIELSDFSLYTQRRRISASFGTGVFCLAGANGLGKSTFLAALSFGLTGVVAPERATFKSMPQYYSRCLAFSKEYFDGRISQRDRESAEVELQFSVRGNQYTLRRNPFEPEALRHLAIADSSGEILVAHDEQQSDERRSELYRDQLVADVGLSSFPQFVFLQHFLLTFDERRRTLFWDEENTEKVLYLALGVDPELAERADELRKKSEGEDSLARNAQYDATTARSRLAGIYAAKDAIDEEGAADTDAGRKLEEAEEERATAANALDAALSRVTDARLVMAAASAAELKAREEYSRQFNLRLAPQPAPRLHPLIVDVLKSHVCPVCASHGQQVARKIQDDLDNSQCPLCASPLAPTVEREGGGRAEALQAADQALSVARENLEEARRRVDRVEQEATAARHRLDTADQDLRRSEGSDPSKTVIRPGDTRAGLEAIERQVNATVEDAISRKEKHIARRDEALAGLRPLRQLLLEAYSEAELGLVPLFQELATQFLGIPLDITLSAAGSERVRLLLTVKNERRRTGNQLSESQRYFLDIALRMALVIHMSAEGSPAPLYIDTPEGSLDIAYESRAGSMFASFAARGHPLIMTANINTSQLLLRLAEECGTDRMTLVRMTEWTNLSDVQAAEERRIEDAYRAIEEALRSHGETTQVESWVARAHEGHPIE